MSLNEVPLTRLRLLALLSAILIIATACSSGGGTATAELPTLQSPTSGQAESTPDEANTDDASGDMNRETDDDGGDDGGDGADGGDDEEVDPEIAMAEYEKCMADEGVSVQMVTESAGQGESFDVTDEAPIDESEIGQEFNPEDFEAAEEVCGPILQDAFGDFEMSPEQEAEMADAMLEMQRCMADAGFDIDLDGGAFEIGPEIDFEAFDTAMRSCSGPIESIGSDQ